MVVAALLSRRLGQRLPELFNRLRLPAVGEKVARVSGEFGAYRRRVLWLHGILLFSVCVQALRMLTHILVALGLGFALGGEQMLQLMVLVPLLAVSLTLPITINGIGLRETVSAKLSKRTDSNRLAQSEPDLKEPLGLSMMELTQENAHRYGYDQNEEGLLVVDVKPGSKADRKREYTAFHRHMRTQITKEKSGLTFLRLRRSSRYLYAS